MGNERHRFQNLYQPNQAVRGEPVKQSSTRRRFRLAAALVLPAALSILVLAGCGVEDVGGLLAGAPPSATVAVVDVPAATVTPVAAEVPAPQEEQPSEAPPAPTEAPASGGQGGGALRT